MTVLGEISGGHFDYALSAVTSTERAFSVKAPWYDPVFSRGLGNGLREVRGENKGGR